MAPEMIPIEGESNKRRVVRFVFFFHCIIFQISLIVTVLFLRFRRERLPLWPWTPVSLKSSDP